MVGWEWSSVKPVMARVATQAEGFWEVLSQTSGLGRGRTLYSNRSGWLCLDTEILYGTRVRQTAWTQIPKDSSEF